MKWFKHMSDSLNDRFMCDLVDQYGAEGYMIFYGILELYSRDFESDPKWILNVSKSFLRQMLKRRKDTVIIDVLDYINKMGRWEVEIQEKGVSIYVPEFRAHLDESTLKKVRAYENSFRNSSGSIPKTKPTDKDKEEDKDKEKNTAAPPLDQDTNRGLEAVCEKLWKLDPAFDPLKAIRYFFKAQHHPKAILKGLESLRKRLEEGVPIQDKYGYLTRAITAETPIQNARDNERICNEFKQPGMADLGNFFKNMGWQKKG